jgi:hypothetical protein
MWSNEIVNVLAPFAMQQILEELETVKCISVMVDTSNHKSLKLVPVLVQYFIPRKGDLTKVIEFHNLKGETADVLTTCIMDKYKLSHKIIAFCVDNCNTNFRGAARKGTNNAFAKLTTRNVKMNIRGIGCAAHILHSALRTSADILPVDAEAIVNKIFQYFHTYTVRVEELKAFCDFVDIQYKQVLGSVKIRWLSLQPAITRVTDNFPGLKSYFLSQEKCPMILKIFFNDLVSIA